jgi:ATP-dependent protease HslVU (ClpYQ) peptidase subunit
VTTIACNREAMACDSRLSWDSEVATVADKVLRIGDALIGCAGHTESVFKFLEWYRIRGDRPDFDSERSFEVVELTRKGIFIYVNSTFPMKLCDGVYACGSGGSAAKAAMLCGKTPAEAVAIAIKCDKNSGPPVRNYAL